jgi:hypothetical protein
LDQNWSHAVQQMAAYSISIQYHLESRASFKNGVDIDVDTGIAATVTNTGQ